MTHPMAKKNPAPHEFHVGETIRVSLHTGKIVEAKIKAVIDNAKGVRLVQVNLGKDKTALVLARQVGEGFLIAEDLGSSLS